VNPGGQLPLSLQAMAPCPIEGEKLHDAARRARTASTKPKSVNRLATCSIVKIDDTRLAAQS
jgi:hypothetical protein